jgi:hypothetical protein
MCVREFVMFCAVCVRDFLCNHIYIHICICIYLHESISDRHTKAFGKEEKEERKHGDQHAT